MANETVGRCVCPLCSEPDAEVRKGSKGRLYIVCDGCVSNIRTMSRAGEAHIAARLGKPLAVIEPKPEPAPAAPTPAPKPAAPTKPAPAPKQKRNMWEDLGL